MFHLFGKKNQKEVKPVANTTSSKKPTVSNANKSTNSIKKSIKKQHNTGVNVANLNNIIDCKEKIDDLITDFFSRDKFIDESQEWAKELRENIRENVDHEFIYEHIYGEVPNYSNNVSKVDFNKDCRTFQVAITDVVDLRNSIRFLRRYIHKFDEFINKLIEVYNEYMKYYLEIHGFENEDILIRIQLMLESYVSDTSYCFNIIGNLLCILNNYYDDSGNINKLGEKLKIVKYDTMKRYYFNHTYSLKSSVKMFNKESMAFGEINNIMKQYNYIYEFVFGTLICDIQTIKTIFDSIK